VSGKRAPCTRKDEAVGTNRYDTSKLALIAVLLPLLAVGQACVAEVSDGGEDGSDVAVTSQALATTFNVMSLNARIPEDSGENAWSQRLPRLASMIHANTPDLIGLQELRAGTHDDLLARMPGYFSYWVDRGDGERIAIFVDTSRFEVLSRSFRNTTNSQRDDSCAFGVDEDSKNRPIQYVKVRDRENGRVRYFYNTHYPSKNSCERRAMSDIVANYIIGRDDPSASVVLVGDVNDGIEPDGRLNTSYSRLLSNTGFISAYAETNPTDSTGRFKTENGTWNKSARSGRMIDHVLVSTHGSEVLFSYVDRSMFSGSGENITRVWCQSVVSGNCSNGVPATSYKLYSDHWAVVAGLAP
jgi:endonuclease/exonuclease/phosphatase family metal-dependent hydrolase